MLQGKLILHKKIVLCYKIIIFEYYLTIVSLTTHLLIKYQKNV